MSLRWCRSPAGVQRTGARVIHPSRVQRSAWRAPSHSFHTRPSAAERAWLPKASQAKHEGQNEGQHRRLAWTSRYVSLTKRRSNAVWRVRRPGASASIGTSSCSIHPSARWSGSQRTVLESVRGEGNAPERASAPPCGGRDIAHLADATVAHDYDLAAQAVITLLGERAGGSARHRGGVAPCLLLTDPCTSRREKLEERRRASKRRWTPLPFP